WLKQRSPIPHTGVWNVPSPLHSATTMSMSLSATATARSDTPYGSLERAVAVAESDIDIVVAECDDVGAAIAGDIGQEPGVPVHAPPLVNTESRDAGGHGERAVTVAQGDIHTVVPEADNVGAAIAGDIGQEP